jgi:hypothetical protein
MNPLDIAKLIKGFLAFIASLFLVRLGSQHEKNKQNKNELKSIRKAREVEAENARLTRDELIDLD